MTRRTRVEMDGQTMGSKPTVIVIRGRQKDLMIGQTVIVVAMLAILIAVLGSTLSEHPRALLALMVVLGTIIAFLVTFQAYVVWEWWRKYVVVLDDRLEVHGRGEVIRSFPFDEGTEMDLLCEDAVHMTNGPDGGQVGGRDRRVVGIKIETGGYDYLLNTRHGWRKEQVSRALAAIPGILRGRGVAAGSNLRRILEGSGREGLTIGMPCGADVGTWVEIPGQ